MQSGSTTQYDLPYRIRLLSMIMIVLSTLTYVISSIFFQLTDNLSQLALFLYGVVLLISIAMYVLATTPFARISVYISLFIAIAVLVFSDPLSGTLSGATWVLFQAAPPVAVLILREPRSTIIMMFISVMLLVTVGSLQILGFIPVQLLADPSALTFNLALQVLVMVLLSVITCIISQREQIAFREVLQARSEASSQLQRANSLLSDQQRLNDDLANTMRVMRYREDQLRSEQQIQQELRRTISQLAAPVVPVLPGVVVLPLVGLFDQDRLNNLEEIVTKGMKQHRAHMVVFDLTGIQSVDNRFAHALFSLMQIIRLLGAETICVGIGPEIAQTMVSIGLENTSFRTMATLQEAILSLLPRR